jgi:hypothetical protein
MTQDGTPKSPEDLGSAWQEVQEAYAGEDERGKYAVVLDEDDAAKKENVDRFSEGQPPRQVKLKRQYADGSSSREHSEADLARLSAARARYESMLGSLTRRIHDRKSRHG